jgi:long-subunit fatty acid transport protein
MSSVCCYEIATPDVGLASAAYAARAHDASTLFKNPAGISRLDVSQFQGGVQAFYGSVSFTPNGNTSQRLGTGDGGNAVGWVVNGHLGMDKRSSDWTPNLSDSHEQTNLSKPKVKSANYDRCVRARACQGRRNTYGLLR